MGKDDMEVRIVDRETLIHFLTWCSVIDYAILILWWLIVIRPHPLLYRLCKRAGVSEEKCDSCNFLGIILFKMGVVMFNLVPLIALLLTK